MAAVIFLLLPLLVASVTYVLRRWRALSSLIAAGASLLLGIALLALPFDQPFDFMGHQVVLGSTTPLLGRALVFDPSTRGAMAFLFLAGAGLFFLSWRLGSGNIFAPVGIGLLGLFAFLNVVGISESAVVAIVIFAFHMLTLTVLSIASISTVIAHPALLSANWVAPSSEGLMHALFFGFAAAMLGISGFESSANFVEEQADGVFPVADDDHHSEPQALTALGHLSHPADLDDLVG